MRSRRLLLSAAALVVLHAVPSGQVRPVYSLGAAGLIQAIGRLQTTASALHIGAHPDDEDSPFIARVARGDHARVAYLSLTRGEGGQNIIGRELFEALGVIRTEELLQARRLDGGEQFFTRAIDFGFSKTREEAAAKWDERMVLDDMVRVIRAFRPLVIYARFSGTPADGHGQHQLSGYLAPIAFKAAADPTQFPEQLKEGLRPWQVRKLYRGVGFRPDPKAPPTLQLQTGIFDPALGRYYTEIASEGRSQHKSQEMGAIEVKGPRESGLIRLDRTVSHEAGLFEGIDTSISGIAGLAGIQNAPQFTTDLGALRASLEDLQEHLTPQRPASDVARIGRALEQARKLRGLLKSLPGNEDAKREADFLLSIKEADLSDALVRASSVMVDPLADSETLVPGGSLGVTVRSFLEDTSIEVVDVALNGPTGWKIESAADTETQEEDSFVRFFRERPTHAARFRVTAPIDAPFTQPYYLDDPRDGDRYHWDESDPKALPFAAPVLRATVTLDVGGARVAVNEPVTYRFADRVRGELRRDVNVVPRLSVGFESRLLIVPVGSAPDRQRVVVRVANHHTTPATGTLRLRLPSGWSASPPESAFSLGAKGDRASAAFVVTAPASRRPGAFDVGAEAVADGVTYNVDLQELAYPHIQTHRIYSPARAVAQVLDLRTAPVTVGYVMGSGDDMPEMIRRMGIAVTLLDDEMLATGELSRFDTIVVGIRASEARPAFVANHRRLMQYVEGGGTLVVQYQQNDYVQRNLPPYPAQMSSRVTDETAPVKILTPDHPVFTFPNRISAADFDGWVQERNLYAFTTFDPRYTPLLETADPGEQPQRGGEVYARVGKGHYIYTAYAWFRQLPAGVPGAYRQFANLIGLSKAPQP